MTVSGSAPSGPRSVLNAAATLTALGGSVMPREVLDAMVASAGHQVDIEELMIWASGELARLTRNEAGYVTCGAAAGLAHSVMACVTHGEPALIARMPSGVGLATEVVMHRAHRIPYDRAIELVGCRIIEVGNVIQTFDWELEAALSERTAAVVWVAGSQVGRGVVSLQRTVQIAHERGIPVVVDAAAQLPPVSNLWQFTRVDGADVVVFSGGKGLRGPQASGVILGSERLICAARANGTPHQRLLRALKVGREEVAGVVAAVRRYVALDHEALLVLYRRTVDSWVMELEKLRGVAAMREDANEAGQPSPRVRVEIFPAAAGISAEEVVSALWERDPRIAVLGGGPGVFYMTPDTLADVEADGREVIGAVCEVIERGNEVTARP